MRTWLCVSLLDIKRNNRNSSPSQLLASCGIESSASSSMNETTAALYVTAILFSFLNLARDSADSDMLYNFAPAVMVTFHRITSIPFKHRVLRDLGSQILIRNLPKERTLRVRSFGRIKIRVFDPRSPNDLLSDPSRSVI